MRRLPLTEAGVEGSTLISAVQGWSWAVTLLLRQHGPSFLDSRYLQSHVGAQDPIGREFRSRTVSSICS